MFCTGHHTYSRNNHIAVNRRVVSTIAVVWVFGLISLASLLSPSASATSSSINVQLSSSTLSLDLMPRANGAFAKSSDNTVNITTNNYTGYTLKLQAGTSGTNATKLVNGATGSTIDSIESSITESAFSADTSEAASNYNGKWGYKPSKYVTTSNNTTTIVDNTGDNAVYLPSPDATNGTTLDITSTANPTTPNTYTISLGARAGYETVAGTYSNTFNFLAIGNPIVYSITFSDDTSDSSVSGLPAGTGSVSTADIDVLIPTTVPTRTGYTFLGWCKEATTDNGTTCSSNTPYPASTPTTPSYYEIDQTADNTDLTFYATWTANTYTITLNGNGATTSGSSSATATYNATTLSTITNPTRSYTISGFTKPSGNNADGATVSSTSTLTSTYTFNGWYKESGATNKIASNATTPALQASTSYTNSSSQWTNDGAVTLYAGWTSQAKTLPTITKPGYTCGWTTTSTGATTISYASGGSLTPTANTTLYGVCKAIDYTVTIHAGNGISALALSGWTGTGTSTLTKTYHIGDTIDLSTASPTYKTGYSGSKYTKNDSIGSLSSATYTVGAGNGDITINASALATPTCSILGGTTKVYNRSATTLTATDNSGSYDTSSTNITYSFGYVLGTSTVDGSTASLGNFSAAQASNTYTVAKNAFRSAYGRFYGVTVTATDKNDSSITATCTSGTGYGTTAAANRTRLILVNSRIDFDANGGTLSGTSPIYVIYQSNASYSSRTGSTARAIPTATPTSSLSFDGWYTSATDGTKVVNADGTIVSSVSGWTDSSGRWIRTSTASAASASNTLYAHYICPSNKICYITNGSNVEGTMGQQSASASSSVTLLASNFSRSGYGFAGWNTKPDYTGTFYGPNETITTPSDMSAGLMLYAIWVQSAGSLQDSTKVAQLCGTGSGSLTQAPTNGTANLSSVSALTDQRDNNTYAIAKLADGKCWMIENLRLADKDSSNNDIILSSNNTNNPSLPITNVYDASNPTTSNHLSPSIDPTITAWCKTASAACIDQSMLNTDNFTNRASSPTTSRNINIYSYGAYYNWYSATAGNGKYSTSTNNSTTAGDICPAGWTLPESGDKTNMAAEKNDVYKLGLSLGLSAPANYESNTGPYWTGEPEGSTASSIFRSYPNNFLYSGVVDGSSLSYRGTTDGYWSKSVNDDSFAYYYNLSSNFVNSSNYNRKYYGFVVRCLAQQLFPLVDNIV